MYNKSININLFERIDGLDVFNSEYLNNLRGIPMDTYTVQVNETRPDLICRKIYGNSDVEALTSMLVLLNGKTTFTPGEVINYISLDVLRYL